jgi:Zn-dependent protease with chaperone function
LALITLIALLAWHWLLLGTTLAITGLTFFLWLAPPAASVVIILGLIRPLMRPRPASPRPMALAAESEPVLFEFVDRLSATLDAPRPAAVCVNLGVNANAGFVGWSGLLTGKLQLTIGLPLAAALTLPQMAGILAHELGHFSQGAGLRSYFLISKTREWLLQVSSERDSWDAWLETHRRAGRWFLMLVANLAWLGLLISRRYLGALARAAQWMTAAFSRHMEFDADRHEATIVGTAVFEQTTLRLPQLRTAADLTWRNVDESWVMGRAPEDLPEMVAAVEQILTDTTAARVREEALARRMGPWDTHPSDSERIAAARAFDAPSLLTLEGEARLLFADLPALCREATRYHYTEIAHMNCDGVHFVSVEESVASLQAKSTGAAAVYRLFHCSPEFAAAWVRFPARVPVAAESAESQCELDVSKEEPLFWAAAEKARLHFCARTIRDAGVNVNITSFELRDGGIGAVRSEHAASEGALRVRMAALNRAVKLAVATLERAAGLVWETGPTYFIFEDGAFSTGEMRDLWRLAGAFSESLDDIWRMRWLISALELVRLNLRLFPLATGANLLQDLEANAEELMERVQSRIGGVVLEGGEVSPTTPLAQGLVARDRGYGAARLESFLRNAEAVRVHVLSRLAHFGTVYGSGPHAEASQAAEAGISRP